MTRRLVFQKVEVGVPVRLLAAQDGALQPAVHVPIRLRSQLQLRQLLTLVQTVRK